MPNKTTNQWKNRTSQYRIASHRIAGMQPVIRKKVPAGAPAGAGSY